MVLLVGLIKVMQLETPMPASIIAREKQYVMEWYIHSMCWTDVGVLQGFIRHTTLYKYDIIETSIIVLIQYNNGYFITCWEIFAVAISTSFQDKLHLWV